MRVIVLNRFLNFSTAYWIFAYRILSCRQTWV